MSTFSSQHLPRKCSISTEVKAAQQALLALREKTSKQSNTPANQKTSQQRTSHLSNQDALRGLPSHLGWGSQNMMRSLPQLKESQKASPLFFENDSINDSYPEDEQKTAVFVSVFPDFAVTLLKEKRVPVGRIWLLLRFLDSHGAGWLELDEIKDQLTNKQSRYRVCGWRQLRNLLNQGEGLFWERQNGRIWLRSLPKVAHALNINRFHTDSVLLPIEILLAKMGTLRAHLFATFHSGRTESATDGSLKGKAPIARATIEAITQISPRIQRLYERSAQVSNQSHYCIGNPYSETNMKEAAWQQGHAAFRFKDVKGLQGKVGCEYVAWQLPNSYAGPHQRQGKRQRQRMNKRLVDLLNKGIVGNNQFMENRADSPTFERRYFANGRFAHQALRTADRTPKYCPNQTRAGFWYDLSITREF